MHINVSQWFCSRVVASTSICENGSSVSKVVDELFEIFTRQKNNLSNGTIKQLLELIWLSQNIVRSERINYLIWETWTDLLATKFRLEKQYFIYQLNFVHPYLYIVVKLKVSCALCFTTWGFVPGVCFQFLFSVRLFTWGFFGSEA